MKKFYEIGSILFDYMLLTLILLISGFLVLPFYAIYVGIIGFYSTDETYKGLFKTIEEYYKKIALLTLLLVIMVGTMVLIFNHMTTYPILAIIIYGLFGYFSLLILTYAPIVMIKMDVSFKELLRNIWVLSIIKFPYTIMLFGILIFMGYLLVYEVIWFVILIVMGIRSISYLSHKALISLSGLDIKREENKGENDEKII